MQTENLEPKVGLVENDGETTKFSKIDLKGNKFNFTVKSSWIRENPDYSTLKIVDMITQRNFYDYLHSTKGPALVDESNNLEAFFINGKWLDPAVAADKEVIERIKHNVQFNAKMEEILA